MTADIPALRIDVADLLNHPAARRAVHLEAQVDSLAGSAARVPDGEPVVLDLVLERVPEGIVVRGTVRAVWKGTCGVCLTELDHTVSPEVGELFEPEPVEGDTYPLEGHEIDLEQLVRDVVLLELPLAPTCEATGRAACAPDVVPERESPPPDPRWAALSELDLS
ncbi:MAG TPA: DUF177 domain-containing protein [Acidimicrobiia bacterium]|nr:DUF177 domain-containing protein [Acidimicrobiia bacterium]